MMHQCVTLNSPTGSRALPILGGARRVLFDTINACVSDDDLDEKCKQVWAACSAQKIDEYEADYLIRCIAGRRSIRSQTPDLRATLGKLRSRVSSRIITRQRPRSPDRKASRDTRRMFGGSSALPPTMRAFYTEGQRAALCIIAQAIKDHGICDFAPQGRRQGEKRRRSSPHTAMSRRGTKREMSWSPSDSRCIADDDRRFTSSSVTASRASVNMAGESPRRLAHLAFENARKMVGVRKTGALGGLLNHAPLHRQPFRGFGDLLADEIAVGRGITVGPKQPTEINLVDSDGASDVSQGLQFQMMLVDEIAAVLKSPGRTSAFGNARRLSARCFQDDDAQKGGTNLRCRAETAACLRQQHFKRTR